MPPSQVRELTAQSHQAGKARNLNVDFFHPEVHALHDHTNKDSHSQPPWQLSANEKTCPETSGHTPSQWD